MSETIEAWAKRKRIPRVIYEALRNKNIQYTEQLIRLTPIDFLKMPLMGRLRFQIVADALMSEYPGCPIANYFQTHYYGDPKTRIAERICEAQRKIEMYEERLRKLKVEIQRLEST